MNRKLPFILLLSLVFVAGNSAFAWKGWTHDTIAKEAYDVLKADPSKAAVVNYLKTAYGSEYNAKWYMGYNAKNEDNPVSGTLGNDIWFDDWWTWSRNGSPSLFGLVDVAYFVALTHFVNAYGGHASGDDHGQVPHGYSYYESRVLADLTGDDYGLSDYDWITRTYNDSLNSDNGTTPRMAALCKGYCYFSSSRFDKNYQDVDFPSAANDAQALYNAYVSSGNITLLLRAQHYMEDSGQPHHAGAYYGGDHTDLEGFAEDNFYNGAYSFNLKSTNLQASLLAMDGYMPYTVEAISEKLAKYSTNNCYATYVNDYTSSQVACLNAVMIQVRGAVAALVAKGIKARL